MCGQLGEALDIPAMEEAAHLLEGRHDFKSFCGNRHMKKSCVRDVKEISLHVTEGELVMDFIGRWLPAEYDPYPRGDACRSGQGEEESL